MRRPSLLKNSSTGARNMGSRTWQEHHITQLPTDQQNAWCRRSSKHWESLLYPRNVLFRNSWCSIGERQHPVNSLRVNCWIPGSYDKDRLPAAIACTHCTRQAIQGDFKVSDDSRLGRCRQGYQVVQGRRSCVCTVPWTSPRQASSLGTCDRIEVIGYSLLQRQGRSSWPSLETLGTVAATLRYWWGQRTWWCCGQRFWTVDGSSHGDTGDCTTDSETFQAQDCTTCPRVRTGQSQTIEKDT